MSDCPCSFTDDMTSAGTEGRQSAPTYHHAVGRWCGSWAAGGRAGTLYPSDQSGQVPGARWYRCPPSHQPTLRRPNRHPHSSDLKWQHCPRAANTHTHTHSGMTKSNLLGKLLVSSIRNKFPNSYGIPSFVAILANVCNCVPLRTVWIQPITWHNYSPKCYLQILRQ